MERDAPAILAVRAAPLRSYVPDMLRGLGKGLVPAVVLWAAAGGMLVARLDSANARLAERAAPQQWGAPRTEEVRRSASALAVAGERDLLRGLRADASARR